MRGPIDFIIVRFSGSTFTGEILEALQKAASDSTIAVLALAVIAKDKDGVITTLDLDEETATITQSLQLDDTLIDTEDVNEVGELLEHDSAAGLLVIEHLWAKDLKQAIINAGGELVADGRIHPEAYEELIQKEV